MSFSEAEPTEIKGIVRHPRIFGGKPIIGQHRISVHDIAAHIRQGYTPEQIVSEDIYPTLTLAEVYAALHYYYDHQEQIDREIVEEDAEIKRLARESISPVAQKIRQAIKERKEKLAQKAIVLDTLTFITSNPDKARLLSQYLDFPVIHKSIDLIEIQSLDLPTILEYKAREAYMQVRAPVLVEDTSLRFLALGKLPGPMIKWFFAELGTHGLCRLLDGYPDRAALAEVQFGLYDGQSFQAFAGAQAGSIALAPRGSNGFGWDSIFIPAGHQKTWAEMTAEESQETSMRRIALQKLEAALTMG